MSSPATPSYTKLLAQAHELADAAGKAVLPYFRRRIRVANKANDGTFDPVTAADHAAERVIKRLLSKTWPEHGIVGEEFGNTRPEARLRWIIDPIDGTRSFVTGSPMWGILIGLMDRDRALLGLVDQPYTRERFWSGPSASFVRDATGRTRRIATRACRRLSDAVMMTTHPDLFAPGHEETVFQRIKSEVRMSRYGGDCYAYCLLASGFVDVIIETGLKPYDVVALIPIIERAGGAMTSWDGGSAASGGRIAVSGDRKLHDTVLKLLSGKG